jgi:hypothetical protein
MSMMPKTSDWPYRVAFNLTLDFDVYGAVTWLKQHVGHKDQDWDITFEYWLFARKSDAVLFAVSWL